MAKSITKIYKVKKGIFTKLANPKGQFGDLPIGTYSEINVDKDELEKLIHSGDVEVYEVEPVEKAESTEKVESTESTKSKTKTAKAEVKIIGKEKDKEE